MAIAEIGVGDMKDFLLPTVASGQADTAAALVKGGQRVAGVGVVLQGQRPGARVKVVHRHIEVGFAALKSEAIAHSKIEIQIHARVYVLTAGSTADRRPFAASPSAKAMPVTSGNRGGKQETKIPPWLENRPPPHPLQIYQ